MNVTDNFGNPVEYAMIDFYDGMEGMAYAETDTLGVAKVYLEPGVWDYTIYSTPYYKMTLFKLQWKMDVDQTIDVTVNSLPTYTVNVQVT
jgi:hypothetical protein